MQLVNHACKPNFHAACKPRHSLRDDDVKMSTKSEDNSVLKSPNLHNLFNFIKITEYSGCDILQHWHQLYC